MGERSDISDVVCRVLEEDDLDFRSDLGGALIAVSFVGSDFLFEAHLVTGNEVKNGCPFDSPDVRRL